MQNLEIALKHEQILSKLFLEKLINSTRAPKYGPQVKQFSSVDDEWIEKLRKNEEAKSKQETERLLETSTVPNGWIQFLIALSLMFILYVNAIFQYFYITAKS